MKRTLVFTLTALLVSCVLACEDNENDMIESASTNQSQLVPSMKGYELYSWETNGHWHYTLITGTNRNKVYDEIVSPDNIESKEWVKISVQGLDNLKKLLARIPAEESILWINSPNRITGFSLPENMIVMQIKNHCSDLGLNLQVIL